MEFRDGYGGGLQLVGGTRPGASWSLLPNLPACLHFAWIHSAGCRAMCWRAARLCIGGWTCQDLRNPTSVSTELRSRIRLGYSYGMRERGRTAVVVVCALFVLALAKIGRASCRER